FVVLFLPSHLYYFCFIVFLMARPPLISILFPYTTLFRSHTFGKHSHGTVGQTLDDVQNAHKKYMTHLFVNLKNVLCRQFPFLHKDRKSTRLNSSHVSISYAVFCLKKKTKCQTRIITRNTR